MVKDWKLVKRKAVAPIIAMILIIPMAASGGAATYVFTQEVVNDTQIATEIPIESARILGYDIRDVSALRAHDGLFMKADTAGISDGLKSKTERIAVYVKNDGPQKIGIKEVRFSGVSYQYSGSGALDTYDSNNSPALGEFVLLSKTPDILTNSELAELESGKVATIVLGLAEDFKIGRSAQFKVTTSNDFVIVGNIQIGNFEETNSGIGSFIIPSGDPPGGDPPGGDPPGGEDPPGEEEPPEGEDPPESQCELAIVNFNEDSSGNPLAAGTLVSGQWHGDGIHISAINDKPSHPDQAILFDSNNPTGGDSDLGAPWTGGNIEPSYDLGKILIIAEDVVDSNSDGLVDDPDDEAKGGIIFMQSNKIHCFLDFYLIDIEQSESNSGHVVIHLSGGGTVEFDFNEFAGAHYGNNSANHIYITAAQIGDTFDEVEFHLNGSGAIDNVVFGS